MKKINVAVVGALGAVGTEMLKILEARNFPVNRLIPMGVAEEAGKKIKFHGEEIEVVEAKSGAFLDADLALFSAGGDASLQLAPIAVQENCVVVDNSSAFRMDPKVPLVVPEVNPQALKGHQGIIANPNCSTIQMLITLNPLHQDFGVKRVVVSTYQAVSGSGQAAIAELQQQCQDWVADKEITHQAYPHQILFNCIPQIDVFQENGFTKEEMKMVDETHKILSPDIEVAPMAVRIPVFRGHSESLAVELNRAVSLEEVKQSFAKQEGLVLQDDPGQLSYPMPLDAEGQDGVFVGRIRKDLFNDQVVHCWISADNLRKGAALNAVQIAEKLVSMNLVGER